MFSFFQKRDAKSKEDRGFIGSSSSIDKSDEEKEGSKEGSAVRTTTWTRRRILFFVALAILIAALVALAIALPLELRSHSNFISPIPNNNGGQDDPSTLGNPGPFKPIGDPTSPIMVVNNFPDPGLLKYNNTWYAYGTNPKKNSPLVHIHVPVAVSKDFLTWTVLDRDALPTVGAWEAKENHWAPDVIQRGDGKFVMFYSGQVKHWGSHHCIGVSVSEGEDPSGPFIPQDQPFACPKVNGGAIDPSPFRDVDGTLYVTYKGDGNSVGHGGDCNNGLYPIAETPIYLQKLESDSITPTGDPVVIFRNEVEDGPLVEAPRMVRTSAGIYYLTVSSHCFTSLKYNVKYATATNITGPYTRASSPLLQTGDYGLRSPGGASISQDGTKMVFHANCDTGRCMFASAVNLDQQNIDLVKLT
jgi:beta-xylosidase